MTSSTSSAATSSSRRRASASTTVRRRTCGAPSCGRPGSCEVGSTPAKAVGRDLTPLGGWVFAALDPTYGPAASLHLDLAFLDDAGPALDVLLDDSRALRCRNKICRKPRKPTFR